jgi:hypothetical protein
VTDRTRFDEGNVGAIMNTQSEAKRFFATKVIDRANSCSFRREFRSTETALLEPA